MFTGLIQALGILITARETAEGKRLCVSLTELVEKPIQIGDSINVSGACLTAVMIQNGNVCFNVVTETLRRTTLDEKVSGDRLNLELSLQPQSYMGGHFVQGHVDAVAEVTAVQNKAEDWRVTIRPPAEKMAFIVPKGSVTIDGVSMTVAEVNEDRFTVAVIPTTLECTTLSGLAVGDRVNIETDILTRTVVQWLQKEFSGKRREKRVESVLVEAEANLSQVIKNGLA